MKKGMYNWANQSLSRFDSTVVLIESDSGLVGAGETCPLGPVYLPAYAEGARAGIAKLAPALIGADPLNIGKINERMDASLKGHPYVKSALDMACWDLFGQATDLPVYTLLGGQRQSIVKLFKVISRKEPDEMVADLMDYQDQGFFQFQMKVGEAPEIDIERILKVAGELEPGNLLNVDANTAWRQHEAMRVVQAIRGLDVYLEQPCLTYEQCLAVRRHCGMPMILDECMDSAEIVIRGWSDSAMDAINLKINRVGGLSRAIQFRDLCMNLGIAMTVEDSWGGEIATAAIAHLAHTLPMDLHFQSSAFHEYTKVELASGAPELIDGYMKASDRPGLGVTPNMDVLGKPVFAAS